jgi:hypothetical protein
MISADTNADKVSQCIELGADDYRNQAQALETQANRTLAVWRDRATQVSGKALPSGHWLTEGVPDETLAEVKRFLAA